MAYDPKTKRDYPDPLPPPKPPVQPVTPAKPPVSPVKIEPPKATAPPPPAKEPTSDPARKTVTPISPASLTAAIQQPRPVGSAQSPTAQTEAGFLNRLANAPRPAGQENRPVGEPPRRSQGTEADIANRSINPAREPGREARPPGQPAPRQIATPERPVQGPGFAPLWTPKPIVRPEGSIPPRVERRPPLRPPSIGDFLKLRAHQRLQEDQLRQTGKTATWAITKLRSDVLDRASEVDENPPSSYGPGVESRPVLGGGGVDFSNYQLGFSINGTELTLKAGKLHHGARTNIAIAEYVRDCVDVEAGDWYAYILYVYGSGSAAWQDLTDTEPQNESDRERRALWLFTVTDGIPVLKQPLFLNIAITGATA